MNDFHVDLKTYGCAIKLHRKDFAASDAETLMIWSGLRFQNYMKWRWYFRYRAALEQVKHPKRLVELVQISKNLPPEIEQQIRHKNRVIAAKAKITKIENAISRAKESYKGNLFEPRLEDTEAFKKAACALDAAKHNLQQLESKS